MNLDADVIVIGGGPCGLMLANELGQRGVRTLLLDQDEATATNPQANATQARTMEHYRRLGFADEVRAQGLPGDYPTDIAYFTRYTTHELARFELPSSKAAADIVKELGGSWSAAELPHRVSQMYVERVLLRHAAALPCVTLRHLTRAIDSIDHGDHVEVVTEPSGGGAPTSWRAGYVVAAEGARSRTRQALGIRLEGPGVERNFMGGRMHALFFRSTGFYDIVPHPKAWMYWAFNPQRRSFLAAVDGKVEFNFHCQLWPGDPEEPTEEQVRQMLFQAMGREFSLEVIGRASWTAGLALLADGFGRGRQFLAGDAVHLFTPTGGLGYNTAVEDAVNLGWKLAALVQGWGGPGLAASYESERRPASARNLAFSRKFADSVGLFAPDPHIEDDTPEGEAARAHAGDYLNRHARAEFDIPGITFGMRYDGSPIILSDGTAPPPDEANRYIPTACPGGRAPHLWLGDGRSLYDLFGRDFTLLRLGPRGPAAGGTATPACMPLSVVDLPGEAARDLYGADFVLIRPDQIVAWRGARPPTEAELRRACGW